MRPLFEQFKQLSETHRFKLLIVAFPVYPQVYTPFVDDTPQQYLKQLGNELDIPVLDTLPLLRQQALSLHDESIYQSRSIYQDLFYDHCHHTEAGSALLADEIFNFIHTELAEP
jgi:hypothetical protein